MVRFPVRRVMSWPKSQAHRETIAPISKPHLTHLTGHSLLSSHNSHLLNALRGCLTCATVSVTKSLRLSHNTILISATKSFTGAFEYVLNSCMKISAS